MKKIAIVGHASVGSCLMSELEARLNAQGVELVINNVEVKNNSQRDPLPFVVKEISWEPIKITQIEPRNYFDKPRFNFKKHK